MEKNQIIYGTPPSKSNCYKIININGHKSLGKTDRLRKYEQDFYLQCNKYRDANIGQFKIYLDVYFPSNRNDLDNAMKVILDCLQRVKAIQNDNKCVSIYAEKYIDKENPRIEFTIVPVDTDEQISPESHPESLIPS